MRQAVVNFKVFLADSLDIEDTFGMPSRGKAHGRLAIAIQNLVWGVSQPVVGMLADRLGAVRIAMLGGLLIGLIEVFWSGYFTVEYKDVAAFSILAIVLIFLPSGLLGKPEVEKV